MAQPLARLQVYFLVLLAISLGLASVSLRPAWALSHRRPDIDSPPFEPDDHNYAHLMRAKRATSDEMDPLVQSIAGYMLSDTTDRRLLNMSDPLDRNISQLLDRNGPEMRPARDYHDFKDITMDMSKRAWTLMREHARAAITNRINLAWPLIEKLLAEARTSAKCSDALKATFAGAQRMESWAVKLLNSWGSFPSSGLFEGTYSDVGAFHTCVNIDRNKYIDHAHYCSLTWRPVMASQKDYELIVRKEPEELLRLFERDTKTRRESPNDYLVDDKFKQVAVLNSTSANGGWDEEATSRDVFSDLLDLSQYHHFLYYKIGSCWPIACDPYDVRRISKLVGRKNVLMTGPVRCFSRSSDDYEQTFEDIDDLVPAAAAAGANEPLPTAGAQQATGANTTLVPRKRKLVVSVWDRNDGIFIWKPQVSKTQKLSSMVLIGITIFIVTMTLIDFCVNKLPRLCNKLTLSLRGLPLSADNHASGHGGNSAVSFDLTIKGAAAPRHFVAACAGAATPKPARRQHPSRAGFQMVPSNNFAADQHEEADNEEDGAEEEELPRIQAAPHSAATGGKPEPSLLMIMVHDCSVLENVQQFFRVTENQMRNDILCLHGIRCITMVWIIMVHTMAFNDWSAFARTRDIELALNSVLISPLFNGSYLVDTFFLMSGLLSALTAFKVSQGNPAKFNSFAFIMGRWLRLTPQIFVTSLVYIVLPTWSYGPHWYPLVGEYSENCVNNWWINVLHMQAFYKTEEMCNFVTWWISIDFFYHFLALAAIWIILRAGHKWGFWSMALLVCSQIAWQSKRHYELALPPNVLSTIPQTGAMWTTMTLGFYWTPYAHAVPFFFGFYLGYLMALKTKVIQKHLNTRRSLIGWTLAVTLLLGQQYSTYWWVTGKAGYSRPVSTLFFGACSIVWNGSICWIIVACQHGYGGIVQRILSWKLFIVLGKASYLIYLSHFQVLFMYFANQTLLIEPTTITMSYAIMGNILLATLNGVFLCCVYEIPWLRAHRRLMKYV